MSEHSRLTDDRIDEIVGRDGAGARTDETLYLARELQERRASALPAVGDVERAAKAMYATEGRLGSWDEIKAVWPEEYERWITLAKAAVAAYSPGSESVERMRDMTKLNFGQAMVALRDGQCVCREGWNGKNMWISFVRADNWSVGFPLSNYEQLPWIVMRTADRKIVPWLASQTDIVAEDWMIARPT